MVVQALRVDASHLDQVACLFVAYRGFYGQPSNLTQSREFIAERIDPGRELFNPSPRLLEHIQNLAA